MSEELDNSLVRDNTKKDKQIVILRQALEDVRETLELPQPPFILTPNNEEADSEDHAGNTIAKALSATKDVNAFFEGEIRKARSQVWDVVREKFSDLHRDKKLWPDEKSTEFFRWMKRESNLDSPDDEKRTSEV